MQSIQIGNQELLGIINKWINVLTQQDRSKYPYNQPRDRDGYKASQFTSEFCCSEEYLKHMQGKKVDGFPEQTRGIDFLFFNTPSLVQPLQELDRDLMAWSGVKFCAVKMLYPATGFMGWHHNANCPGYNILLSWSKEGKGYFRYQDPITKELVTMKDSPGWTCKVGYYGAWHEEDKIYWHSANAEHEERFTLGYVIPHQGMWEDMVADIEG